LINYPAEAAEFQEIVSAANPQLCVLGFIGVAFDPNGPVTIFSPILFRLRALCGCLNSGGVLGRSDLSEPDGDGDEHDESHEVGEQFVIGGCDAPELLERPMMLRSL
jgi:hypothetical protein